MKMTKKDISKLCEKYDYCFYDYFIDDIHTENKYYIKNWWTGDFKGFDRLSDICGYLNGTGDYDYLGEPVNKRKRFI